MYRLERIPRSAAPICQLAKPSNAHLLDPAQHNPIFLGKTDPVESDQVESAHGRFTRWLWYRTKKLTLLLDQRVDREDSVNAITVLTARREQFYWTRFGIHAWTEATTWQQLGCLLIKKNLHSKKTRMLICVYWVIVYFLVYQNIWATVADWIEHSVTTYMGVYAVYQVIK